MLISIRDGIPLDPLEGRRCVIGVEPKKKVGVMMHDCVDWGV